MNLYCLRSNLDCSILSQWTSLHTLRLRQTPGVYNLTSLFRCLPSSLTCLDLGKSSFDKQIKRSLSDPTFLPHLRYVKHSQDKWHDNGESWLFPEISTVMLDTKHPRPIEQLMIEQRSHSDSWLSLDWCTTLLHLQLVIVNVHEGMEALVSQADDVWPRLNYLNIEFKRDGLFMFRDRPIAERPLDLSPLFKFVSKRPISTLVITCSVPSQPLTREAIQAFYRMSKLTSLHMMHDISDKTYFFDASEGLPVGNWPLLETIGISGHIWSKHHLPMLLGAVPNLKTFTLRDSSYSLIPYLPLIAHTCHLIESIDQFEWCHTADRNAREAMMQAVQAAFAAAPLTSTTFKHLSSLRIQAFGSSKLIHFLCSRLSSLPSLSWFGIGIGDVSPVALCCISLLPYLSLDCYRGFTHAWYDWEQLASLYDEYRDVVNRTESNIADRQVVLASIRSHLPDGEQQALERWDMGDYSSQPYSLDQYY